MCGRYQVSISNADVAAIVAEAQKRVDAVSKNCVVKTEELFPTDVAAILVDDAQKGRVAVPMVWGFEGFGSRKGVIFNTRRETALQKSFWRSSLEQRRCVVPATGFYEWQHGGTHDKQKYRFYLPDTPLLYMAGIFTSKSSSQGAELARFSIMTAEANESVASIHNRMPVILRAHQLDDWLSGDYLGLMHSDALPQLAHEAA
jgi:putative SOS response-associated peptidase YedK